MAVSLAGSDWRLNVRPNCHSCVAEHVFIVFLLHLAEHLALVKVIWFGETTLLAGFNCHLLLEIWWQKVGGLPWVLFDELLFFVVVVILSMARREDTWFIGVWPVH